MDLLPRTAENYLRQVAGHYPVVTITGPRQSGKTTLCRKVFPEKKYNKGNIYGGLLFGLGWGITGACPGPLFAQIGTGVTVITVTLLSAIVGTWVYGKVIDKLPR